MPKKIAVHFPGQKAQVPAYMNNADDKLNAGGLAVKYAIVAPKVARMGVLNTDLPQQLNDARISFETTQSLNAIADASIREANLLNHDIGDTMQKHVAFALTDYESMGYKVTHVPPDPLTAKPEIARVTPLSDMIVFDWVRGFWKGIVIYASSDGLTWTKLDKDFRSPFEDKRKNHTPNVPENRHYKFRYIDANENEIGLETIVTVLAAIY